MLFEITHHGTRIDNPHDGRYYFENKQIVESDNGEALVQWATTCLFPLHDRITFDRHTQAVTISAFRPAKIVKNDMQLEGSSKWMGVGTAHSMALWSTDFDPEHNENAIKAMTGMTLEA